MRRVLGGSRKVLRSFLIGATLVATCAACEINVQLVTKVDADGSGRFSLRFVIDKELVDLARNAGEDPFQALACPDELTKIGWTCGRSTEGGGLVISLERAFRSTDEFNRAMEQLEDVAAEQEGPTAQFFTLRVSRESGFLKTKTAVQGSVDLTSSGVLGEASPDSREALETIIEQAAGEFFTFHLRAELPGSVTSATGDPEVVDGGTVTWEPRLGKQLTFLASSSAYNVGSLAVLGAPVLVLVALLVWTIVRRNRRKRPASPDAPEEIAATPV